ncbi:MAG: hypothetical protein RL210_724, partial [Pseudomonadota bacterium]
MSLDDKIQRATALLTRIAAEYSPAVFANSLGAEDMVITDLIARNGLNIEIFSLDTGRLPAETYTLLQKTGEAYPAAPIKVYFPNTEKTEAWVAANGINAFYNSIEQRKACCHIRKIEPLKRALAGKKAWITGLRAQKSTSRTDLGEQEFDKDNG